MVEDIVDVKVAADVMNLWEEATLRYHALMAFMCQGRVSAQ